LTNQEVRARALEALSRKREGKRAEKEERRSYLSKNIAKAPNNVQALLDELNELAEKDLMKKPEVDPNRIMMLQADYEKQWDLASSEDRDKASVRFVPRNMFYYR
jgi:hypothetical protein